ncbi:MAG: hypothetical protein QNK03_09930 [Myxococcota bacterium]|nr:hypothetical protein [Myxococcota bacterium]
MSRFLNRLASRLTSRFVAHGVSIDDDGRLCFPDGLDPERIQRFIELCVGRRYDCPRSAMHDLFRRADVSPRAVELLEHIVREDGHIDVAAAARRLPAVTAALPALHQIPERFREFLVSDLGLADPASHSLEAAVVSARETAAARMGCASRWDAILERPEQVAALTADWRERAAGGS